MAYDGIMMHQVKNLLIETIKGGRINKIYQISKYELLFQVRANKKNYQLLISSHPMYARVQLTSLSYPTPESPNPLTMLYRKVVILKILNKSIWIVFLKSLLAVTMN